jgi:hypothetical protein
LIPQAPTHSSTFVLARKKEHLDSIDYDQLEDDIRKAMAYTQQATALGLKSVLDGKVTLDISHEGGEFSSLVAGLQDQTPTQ